MKVRPAVIIVQERSILTMRYKYGEKEVYALPGGNPDPNECLPEALQRELREELGIRAEIGDMVLCGEVLWSEIKKEILHMVFSGTILEGEPVLNPAETSAQEVVWLPFSELESRLLYPNVGRDLRIFLEGGVKPAYVGVIDQPYAKPDKVQ